MIKTLLGSCALTFALVFFGSTSFAGDKGIYGVDSRKDIFEADPHVRRLARSAAAVMGGDMPAENGMVGLDLQEFRAAFSLCPGERFPEQPVGASCTASLVGPDLVLTAGHCISEVACSGKKFVFGFELGVNGEWPSKVPASDAALRLCGAGFWEKI